MRPSLDDYLAMEFPFKVIADPEGGYVIEFPDLPGCLSAAETLGEVGPMAEDAFRGWMESSYANGADIPLPSYPEEYSGKFNLRLPRSLHRRLAEAAERDGVSLNTYVIGLLERAQATAAAEARLERIEEKMDTQTRQLSNLRESLRDETDRVPPLPDKRHQLLRS